VGGRRGGQLNNPWVGRARTHKKGDEVSPAPTNGCLRVRKSPAHRYAGEGVAELSIEPFVSV